jgi:hypothetical protein
MKSKFILKLTFGSHIKVQIFLSVLKACHIVTFFVFFT